MSEELRDEMVAQGVKFLKHPSVQNTPMSERVSFMEGKGLTAEEIKEVLRQHKADPTPSAPTPAPAAAAAPLKRLQPGPRMSGATVHGGVVYVTGQVAEGATVAEQTRACLAKVDALLAEAGSSKSKVLMATIYLTSMEGYDEMNAEWDAWVDPQSVPSRACVQSALALPQFKVEVVVSASTV